MLAPVVSSCCEAFGLASVCFVAVAFAAVAFAAAAFFGALGVDLTALAFEAVVLEADALLALVLPRVVAFAAGFLAAAEPVFVVLRRAVVFFVVDAAGFFVPPVSSLMLFLVMLRAFLVFGRDCAARQGVGGLAQGSFPRTISDASELETGAE